MLGKWYLYHRPLRQQRTCRRASCGSQVEHQQISCTDEAVGVRSKGVVTDN